MLSETMGNCLKKALLQLGPNRFNHFCFGTENNPECIYIT